MRVQNYLITYLIAIFVSPLVAYASSLEIQGPILLVVKKDDVSAPTLAQTEEFIESNLSPSPSTVSASIASISAVASCKEIQITISYYDLRDPLLLSFSPSKVEYSIPDPKIKDRFVSIECIKKKCISRQRYRALDPEILQSGLIMTTVVPSRMVKALQHHQDLCGGKETTPF